MGKIDWEELSRLGRPTVFRAHRPLLKVGSARAGVIVLLQGVARAFHRSRGGREVTIRMLQAPALIGDVEVLARTPVFERVESIERCETAWVSRGVFLGHLARHPELQEALLRSLSERLLALSDQCRAATLANTSARLADALLDFAALTPPPKTGPGRNRARIEVRLGEHRLARELGVGRTSVTQALQLLKSEQLVTKQHARFEVPNLEALQAHGSRVVRSVHTLQQAVATKRPTRSVRVRLPIPVVEAGQAPFYAALLHGHYRRFGLEIELSLAEPGHDPISAVASGTDDIGVVGGPEALIAARARGLPVKAVGLLHRDSNFSCLLTLRSSGIRRLAQLRGRRVGFYYGHVSTLVLRTLLRGRGIRCEEVDVGFDYSALVAGQVAAQWAFTVTAGLDLPALGVNVNVVSPATSGYNTDGYVIFTRDEVLEESNELVRRFVAATQEGVRDVLDSPERAVALLHAQEPTLNVELTRRRLALYGRPMVRDIAGALEKKRWQQTYDRMLAAGVIDRELDVQELLA